MKELIFIKRLIYLYFFIYSVYISAEVPPYGYYLGKDDTCSLWWTEGIYKVKWEDKVPDGTVKPVILRSARNEYESFQLIINPKKNISGLSIEIENLKDKSGHFIDKKNITIRNVLYLYVDQPTDAEIIYPEGWYPDPLPLLNKPVNLAAGKNHPIWITVKTPKNTIAGKYSGNIIVKTDNWSKKIPMEVNVWNFTLPEKPSMRSSFGVYPHLIKQYNRTKTSDELKKANDAFFKVMSDYKVGPTKPFELYPMKVNIDGLYWEGGAFITNPDSVYSGKKSLKIVDQNPKENAKASTTTFIRVEALKEYKLLWKVRTGKNNQKYTILIEGFDKDKKLLMFENRLKLYYGNRKWQEDTLHVRPFKDPVKFIKVHLFPTFRTQTGWDTGTAWFDEISLKAEGEKMNLIKQGNFEVTPEELTVNIDFTDFDLAGEKFIDGLGFTSFHLELEGMPSGNFYRQYKGVFHGFSQGTPEYDKMMKKYLMIVQRHLEEKKWLGKEYVYWFDEPSKKHYPFVRNGMNIIRRSAPKLTTFITEHEPGSPIMDVVDISCPNISRLDPVLIKEWTHKGREFWSYISCCPGAPYIDAFIDHEAINLRTWLWLSYKYDLKGILIWVSNWWNSDIAVPDGYLQNPYKNPMSYRSGRKGAPFGYQHNDWGNGDGRMFYPAMENPNENKQTILEGPVPSLRMEILRDGMEDYEYMILLQKTIEQNKGKNPNLIKKAKKLLLISPEIVKDQKNYSKDPKYLLSARNKMGELLNTFNQ